MPNFFEHGKEDNLLNFFRVLTTGGIIDCWQTDALAGPYLTVDGRKKATYLIAFLDDASRLLVHGEFFFEENSRNLQIVLKKAILKRGIPKRVFADNGKIFDSLQLRLVCASLGVLLSHGECKINCAFS